MTEDQLVGLAKSAAMAASVEPELVCAVCEQESSWNPWAVRYEPAFFARYVQPQFLTDATEAQLRAVSWGLMQIMGETAREEGFKGHIASLCDPQTGLDAGIEHLKRMLSRSGGNWPIALNLYNGGSNPQYATEVMARVDKYKEMNNGTQP